MMKKYIILMDRKVVCVARFACLLCLLCWSCVLSVFAQDGNKISKEDSLVFRKYLHVDMPLRTDVVLLQNIYHGILQEYAMGITANSVPATYNSVTGKIQHYDVPTVVMRKKLESQFEDMHRNKNAFEQGKQELIERLTAYGKEAKDKPIFYADIETKFRGDIVRYVEHLYENSIMGNSKMFKRFIHKPHTWTIQEDPGFQFTLGLLLFEMALQGK